MWREYINWRIKNKVDSLTVTLNKIIGLLLPRTVAAQEDVPARLPQDCQECKAGIMQYSPIYIERIGLTNIEEIWKITTPDRLLNYYAMLYECLLSKIFDACTEQRKRETGNPDKVMQTCTILDMKDIKLGNASASYKFVKPAS